MTHTILDIDTEKAVIVVCNQRRQIESSASLRISTAMDVDKNGQDRFRVGSSRRKNLVEFSNEHN